jgi:dTDP-glucose 4,6-dehydratase
MGKPETEFTFVNDRPGHDRRYAVDWTSINQKLGWKPTVSLEEGMLQTINWYKAHPEWWQPLKTTNQAYFESHYAQS